MQLVLNFVDDAYASVAEMRRLARPDGTVAACVWDDDRDRTARSGCSGGE
jgi:hypothetical protein